MKQKILIVEDDPHIALGLRELLHNEGFAVVVCSRGDEAISTHEKEQPDLMVLDVMLPGLSGYDVCKQLRAARQTTPILMLTAKGREMDKVAGLEFGADDYVTKPFGVRELLARVQALLRRSQASARDQTSVFRIGPCEIDPPTFQLRRGDVVEELTAREMKLLQLFYSCPNHVFSRDKLLNEVWGYGYHGTTRTLDQVIVQLRRKLGDVAEDPRHLLTVHGIGYKLVL